MVARILSFRRSTSTTQKCSVAAPSRWRPSRRILAHLASARNRCARTPQASAQRSLRSSTRPLRRDNLPASVAQREDIGEAQDHLRLGASGPCDCPACDNRNLPEESHSHIVNVHRGDRTFSIAEEFRHDLRTSEKLTADRNCRPVRGDDAVDRHPIFSTQARASCCSMCAKSSRGACAAAGSCSATRPDESSPTTSSAATPHLSNAKVIGAAGLSAGGPHAAPEVRRPIVSSRSGKIITVSLTPRSLKSVVCSRSIVTTESGATNSKRRVPRSTGTAYPFGHAEHR